MEESPKIWSISRILYSVLKFFTLSISKESGVKRFIQERVPKYHASEEQTSWGSSTSRMKSLKFRKSPELCHFLGESKGNP